MCVLIWYSDKLFTICTLIGTQSLITTLAHLQQYVLARWKLRIANKNSMVLSLPVTLAKCKEDFPVDQIDSGRHGENGEWRFDKWSKEIKEAWVRSFVKAGEDSDDEDYISVKWDRGWEWDSRSSP